SIDYRGDVWRTTNAKTLPAIQWDPLIVAEKVKVDSGDQIATLKVRISSGWEKSYGLYFTYDTATLQYQHSISPSQIEIDNVTDSGQTFILLQNLVDDTNASPKLLALMNFVVRPGKENACGWVRFDSIAFLWDKIYPIHPWQPFETSICGAEYAGVEENAKIQSLRVSPNPTTGTAKISIGGLRMGELEISDVLGRLLHKEELNSLSVEISPTDFPV